MANDQKVPLLVNAQKFRYWRECESSVSGERAENVGEGTRLSRESSAVWGRAGGGSVGRRGRNAKLNGGGRLKGELRGAADSPCRCVSLKGMLHHRCARMMQHARGPSKLEALSPQKN